MVNSSALKFIDIGWFESPDEKRYRQELAILMEKDDKEKRESMLIQTLEIEVPDLFKYIDENIAPKEMEHTYEKLAAEYLTNTNKH
jgi:hypothetical protein